LVLRPNGPAGLSGCFIKNKRGEGTCQGLPTVYQTVSMRNQPLQQEPSGKKAILQRVRVYEARLIRPWLSASSGRIKNGYYFKYQIVKPCYSSKT